MADGKIYITISDKPAGTGGGGGTETKKKEKTQMSTSGYIMHELRNFVTEQAKTMVSYTIGNIGNFTGDYETQREVEYLTKAVSVAKNITFAAIGGANAAAAVGVSGATGGWIGVALAVASMGVNFALGEVAAAKTFKRQNYDINQLRKLSGLNISLDGGRGTLE